MAQPGGTQPEASSPPPDPATRPTAPATAPADPEAFDAPRARQARARGLAAPYIPGGADPDAEAARREERRYLRLLIAMVAAVVLSGWVLGILANLFRGA